MKTKRFLALLTALVMVLAVMPGLAFAADVADTVTVEATKTATHNVKGSGSATDDVTLGSYPSSSLFVYHSNWNQRNAYVGFDLSNAFSADQLSGKKVVKKATLSLNCAEADIGSTVSIVAIDNSKWKESEYVKPEDLGLPAHNITSSTTVVPGDMVVLSEQTVNNTGTYDFDVTEYVAENFVSLKDTGISFAVININTTTSTGEIIKVLFEGKDGSVKPKLTVELADVCTVELTLKSGDTSLRAKTVTSYVGDQYIPSDEDAPLVVEKDGEYYTRNELKALELTEGTNSYTAEYTKTSIDLDSIKNPDDISVIEGDKPFLPKTLSATLADGKNTVDVPVTWQETDTGYTTTVGGKDINIKLETLRCDHSIDVKDDSKKDHIYNGGNSDGAQFVWNNKLGTTYAGGNVIFDTTFTISEGTNKLISYGNETTSTFDGTGPIVRFMNKSVFEYHDTAWKDSNVPCETGKTYRLRTVVDFADKKYQMYITDENGVKTEVTNGPAAFRNSSLDSISLMFVHGAGYEAGENNYGVTSHRVHWEDGWTELTLKYLDEDNNNVFDPKTIKWTTDKAYTDDTQGVAYDKESKNIYVTDDINKAPYIEKVNAENNVLEVNYHKVTAECDDVVANTVVGSAPTLPADVLVKFSDGQSKKYSVKWNGDADVTAAGDTSETGTIEEIGLEVTCTVHVKEVEIDNETLANKNTVATNNGGWNWYVEPSGTHIQPGDDLAKLYQGETKDSEGNPIVYTSNNGYKFEHDRTYMGWVEDCGDIVVAQYDHDTDTYDRVVIHEKLESDDHNNPAVVVLPDGRIMAVYSMHTNEAYMYFRVTKAKEDITQGWEAEQYYYCETNNDLESKEVYNATYPTVFMVHDDTDAKGDAIYVGWRGVHWKPTLAKFPMPDENGRFGSDKDGEIVPVMGQTQIANTSYYSFDDGGKNDTTRRPYTKYDYDEEKNLIYITYTANHPDNDKRNHIFYMTLNVNDQNIYTANGTLLQPLPFENKAEFKDQGAPDADGTKTNGQWGVMTAKLYNVYPDLVVFDASEQTGMNFTDPSGGSIEHRGWTWDISHNENGEPCVVYADITATEPGPNGELPSEYLGEDTEKDNSRSHHYYWYARWDKETGQWVKTFLTYAGKWFHQNATQERCYSGGLTFDHNADDANVIYLSIPTDGTYGKVFEIYRWESDDHGSTWTKRQALTQNSPVPNARPNAIYNYKMNDDGTNAGPRLLWISGEYRYWMNYEYHTGVMTDFQANGFKTQDDPEMFADAALEVNGEEIDKLPVGETTFNGKFVVSNISIGSGDAKFALAHYDNTGKLVGFKSQDEVIPARSVPQTSLSGADEDNSRDNGRSAMGEPQIEVDVPYTGEIKAGDKIKLFAWDMGVEQPLSPIISIPVEISTNGSRYLYSEDFTYEAEDKLMLDKDGFNGWTGKIYDSNGTAKDMSDEFYAAVTKTAFGNSGIHLYRVHDSDNGQGVMVSHSLPIEDTNGEDFTIEFDMRYINEWSWQNIQNGGFTLSHGIPTKIGDKDHPSAIQIRHQAWGNGGYDENGRNNTFQARDSVAFDSGSLTTIGKYADIYRYDGMNDPERFDVLNYQKGEADARYDKVEQIYIHDYNDGIMDGALLKVKVKVHPSLHLTDISIYDGYRMIETVVPYNTDSDVDWDANPVDTITFSIGQERWGEIYIDNLRMYLDTEPSNIRTVELSDGTRMFEVGQSGTTWNLFPKGDGRYVFFSAATGQVIDVSNGAIVSGGTCGMYKYKGPADNADANQCFYMDEVEGGIVLSIPGNNTDEGHNCYVRFESDAVTLTNDINRATVFTVTDLNEEPSATVLEIVEMIEDGTYEATMDAILDEE